MTSPPPAGTKRAPRDPCEPNPCGANTEQRSVGKRCVCTCLPNHFGDPTTGCKYECVRHEDCPAQEAWYVCGPLISRIEQLWQSQQV